MAYPGLVHSTPDQQQNIGVLQALGSDFWRMAVVGVLAARQGVLEVAVFTVGYRFLWLCLIVTSSVARAAGIQISISIGQGCVGAAIIQAKVIRAWHISWLIIIILS